MTLKAQGAFKQTKGKEHRESQKQGMEVEQHWTCTTAQLTSELFLKWSSMTHSSNRLVPI